MRLTKTGLTLISIVLISACGGGGGSTAPVVITPPPIVVTGPTWTKDVFQAESNFKNRCAAPRSGTNPATGNAYPDVAGSTLFEKHWLRSWSNNTYLWYNEIDDKDPALTADRVDYFDLLKTEATTASGNDRDRFHFNINTADYQQRVSSGASAGYGAELALISSTVPRDIRIAFIEPNSPAATAALARGAVILEIDGVDAINGSSSTDVDTLNAGLFPSDAGESHTFKIQDLGAASPRTITMNSAIVTTLPVNISKTIDVAANKVGYLHFTTFGTSSAESAVVNAMQSFASQGISDLVLDLRYNGGGFLDIAGELGYMIAGPARTSGKTFDNNVFNNKHTVTNPVTGQTLTPTPFHNTTQGFSGASGQALPNVNLSRVFILSTSGTCSASEAVINGLRGVNVEVVLIGSTTCGKPYGFYATDNCGETYFTIQFRGENDKGFGDYTDGFTPIDAATNTGELITGCEIADDFGNALGDEAEAQLSAAISYIQTGSCPIMAPTRTAKNPANALKADDATSLFTDERVRNLYRLKQTLLLNAPSAPEGQ